MCLYLPMALPFLLLFIPSCESKFSLSIISFSAKDFQQFFQRRSTGEVFLLLLWVWKDITVSPLTEGQSQKSSQICQQFPFHCSLRLSRGCVLGVAEFKMISFVWNILQEHGGICPMASRSLRQEPRSWFSIPEAGLVVRN